MRDLLLDGFASLGGEPASAASALLGCALSALALIMRDSARGVCAVTRGSGGRGHGWYVNVFFVSDDASKLGETERHRNRWSKKSSEPRVAKLTD